jgi:hypothetical protein
VFSGTTSVKRRRVDGKNKSKAESSNGTVILVSAMSVYVTMAFLGPTCNVWNAHVWKNHNEDFSLFEASHQSFSSLKLKMA